MTFAEFLNGLKRLHCIEGWNVEGLSDERQILFVNNPVQFLLRADEETQRQIWLAMERDREIWKEHNADLTSVKILAHHVWMESKREKT